MKKTILLVEDDRSSAKVTSYALQKAGYKVIIATDGLDGLAKAKKEKPGLIILDIMLPGMYGLQLCRELREMPQTATTPILVLSAKAQAVDVTIGFDVGADDYLTKPVTVAELVRRVKELTAGAGDLRQSSYT